MPGVISGAIIGGIAGAAFVAYKYYQNSKWAPSFLEKAANDKAAARGELDRYAPAKGNIALSDIEPLRQRMAGLAILRDVGQLQHEIASMKGGAVATGQVIQFGLLSLITALPVAERAQHVAKVEDLNAVVTRETNALQKLVRVASNHYLALAQTLAYQTPLPVETAKYIRGMAYEQIGLVSILSVALYAQTVHYAVEAVLPIPRDMLAKARQAFPWEDITPQQQI